MAFVLPTFNITCDIYTAGTWPGGVARIANQPCQLRAPAANFAASVNPTLGQAVGMTLLLPAGTDIRDRFNTPINSSDVVECPSGSGRAYTVATMDDIALGFANEHRYAVLQKVLGFPWPTPSP